MGTMKVVEWRNLEVLIPVQRGVVSAVVQTGDVAIHVLGEELNGRIFGVRPVSHLPLAEGSFHRIPASRTRHAHDATRAHTHTHTHTHTHDVKSSTTTIERCDATTEERSDELPNNDEELGVRASSGDAPCRLGIEEVAGRGLQQRLGLIMRER